MTNPNEQDDKQEQQEKEINFTVSFKEANLILKALGKLPFEDVYEIIGKLNVQANKQLSENKEID